MSDPKDSDQKPPVNSNNWYAKLHPIGREVPPIVPDTKPKKILNLSLFFRIWIAVGVIVIISGIVVFNQLFNYVRPITQQVIEDTLVDTSKLLAASLQSAVESGEIYDKHYQAMLDKAFLAPETAASNEAAPNNTAQQSKQKPSKQQSEQPSNTQHPKDNDWLDSSLSTDSWYHEKTHSSFRVYITDKHGMVIYDSLPKDSSSTKEFVEKNAEGEDYSSWNDVNLTLQGKYGARTTRTDPEDSTSSIMYVAQPIYSSADNQQIIGVVSIGKPTATILPYLNATRQRMLTASLIISILTLFMAGLIAWWLRQSTLLVTKYTQSLAQDTKKPYFYLGKELNELSDTIESMKHRLENRAYVTDYVHTLTHELKSPLTAIRASGELLEETDLDSEDRLMLSQTITEQSIKLQSLIDRLLLLAKIEQPTFKLTMQPINPDALIKTLISGSEMQRQNQHVQIDYQCQIADPETKFILADEFWITQALQNVLDNALYFAKSKVIVHLGLQSFNKINYIQLSIINNGDLIPEYALEKVFDRYFSLSHQYHRQPSGNINAEGNTIQPANNPQPQTQAKKGTGLGLTLVKQVIERHGGMVTIHNLQSFPTESSEIASDEIASGKIESTAVELTLYLPVTSVNP
ncbi:two-component system sensor histidine kinase CreC [Psychrobacter phenylpyruvicus]|uniref:histidine kinase n=1 Tax=Psychrobacter phenylpyruvicus TaxID=29432 RepID=A0A379LKC3_9GAMM|nr:two-component system sensor histidine kinase CreC [Psychrobacter phenylpyruvicus]SUD91046.1 Sensor protein CreC [Psychrobacter phenylpyruvicus]